MKPNPSTQSLVTVLNQKQTKNGIRGDRASVLGNPFDMGRNEGLRDQVCDAYDDYFAAVLDGADPTTAAPCIAQQTGLSLAAAWKQPSRDEFIAELNQLEKMQQQGNPIKLLCWCSPCRCHLNTVKTHLDKQRTQQATPKAKTMTRSSLTNKEVNQHLLESGFTRTTLGETTYQYDGPRGASFQFDRPSKTWSMPLDQEQGFEAGSKAVTHTTVYDRAESAADLRKPELPIERDLSLADAANTD